jgi:hypothetical protein
MRGLRAALVGTAIAALALTALGAPVGAASKVDLAIVNGNPGVKVDVCIGAKEVKSALPYGKVVFHKAPAGWSKLRFFKKDPRRCKGVLLAKKRIHVPLGYDKTVVLTRKTPLKVVVFDNAGLGQLGGSDDTDSAYGWRHAADVGKARFSAVYDHVTPMPVNPALVWEEWEKGDHAQHTWFVSSKYLTVTYEVELVGRRPLLGPYAVPTVEGRRYEWILVGTTARNARLVKIVRPVLLP